MVVLVVGENGRVERVGRAGEEDEGTGGGWEGGVEVEKTCAPVAILALIGRGEEKAERTGQFATRGFARGRPHVDHGAKGVRAVDARHELRCGVESAHGLRARWGQS